MKDFSYYSGDDIKRPIVKNKKDFTTITAELRNFSNVIVDIIKCDFGVVQIKDLRNAGYTITEYVDSRAYEAYIKNYKKEVEDFCNSLTKRQDEFISDICSEFHISLYDARILFNKAKKIALFYTDYIDDDENFDRDFSNHFKLYYHLIDEII